MIQFNNTSSIDLYPSSSIKHQIKQSLCEKVIKKGIYNFMTKIFNICGGVSQIST